MPTKIAIASAVIVVGIVMSVYAVTGMDMDTKVAQATKVDLENIREYSHSLGSPDAPITIIEFGDFQCPFCSEWYIETAMPLKEKYIESGQVELLFVDYPFLGDDSYPTAHASYCAEQQGMYWEFHEILYLNQGDTNDGWAIAEKIRDFASQVNLDMKNYDECMASSEFNQKIDESLELGERHEVNQTPTFIVVNNSGEYQKIEGKQPLVVFEELMKKMS